MTEHEIEIHRLNVENVNLVKIQKRLCKKLDTLQEYNYEQGQEIDRLKEQLQESEEWATINSRR